MPRTWKLRIFFLLYVCYGLGISTDFKAFLVSCLVEPGYGETFAIFLELLDFSVNYGFIIFRIWQINQRITMSERNEVPFFFRPELYIRNFSSFVH
jgi:hypothetical protein